MSVPEPVAPRAVGEREERRPVDLVGWLLRADGSYFDVLLTDLSYCGCKIRCTAPLDPGEKIRLSVAGRGGMEAEVRWRVRGHAGLVFSEAGKERLPRQAERVEIGASVHVRRPGRNSYRVQVFDLSPHGCKIEFVERPRRDDRVLVRFDGLEAVQGQVCWVKDFHGGLRFSAPIHPAVFDLLLARLGVS